MQTQDRGSPLEPMYPELISLVQSDPMWAMDKMEVLSGMGLAPIRVLTAIIMDNYYNICIYS